MQSIPGGARQARSVAPAQGIMHLTARRAMIVINATKQKYRSASTGMMSFSSVDRQGCKSTVS